MVKMYEGWCSVQEEIQRKCEEQNSLLTLFPPDTANLVAQHIVLSLKVDWECNCGQSYSVAGAGMGREASLIAGLHSVRVETDAQVRWVMQAINHALTMPFNYWDVVKHSAHVYCRWLRALLPQGTDYKEIPAAIRQDPNRYAQDIILSLCRFFVPRQWRSGGGGTSGGVGGGEASGRREEKRDEKKDEKRDETAQLTGTPEQQQPTLMHHVLRSIELIARESTLINPETWECLLQFCLAVNHIMLAPPPEPDDLSEQMSGRLVGVMFSVWLEACVRCFPRPPLWRSFAEMCRSWRHHEALINQWHRVNAALTARLLKLLYSAEYPDLPALDDSTQRLVPRDMSEECVKECWFRFLHLLGNPVDLCHPKIIAQTEAFSEFIRAGNQGRCLQALSRLPGIFLHAMRSVAILADAFLGLRPSPAAAAAAFPGPACLQSQPSVGALPAVSNMSAGMSDRVMPSPPETRRFGMVVAQGGSVPPSSGSTQGISTAQSRVPVIEKSMKKNKSAAGSSMQASVPHSTSQTAVSRSAQGGQTGVTIESISSPHPLRPEGNSLLHLLGAWLFEAAVTGVPLEMDNAVISNRASQADPVHYQYGRAEACGALCRIFCNSRRDGILSVYLARFYMCMHYGLATEPAKCSAYVLSTILFNSPNLLRVDLEGVNILVPRILLAVDAVLKTDDRNWERPDYMSAVQLKRAGIHQLLSMICLPLQFKGLTIKSLLPVVNDAEDPVAFYDLKRRVALLLSESLKTERDPVNLQMLLGGMLALLEDLATEEAVEIFSQLNLDERRIDKIETASGLFSHALGLLCIHVVHVWKNDLSTVLFALEVLCGISKVGIKQPDKTISKRSVRFICEFIVNQCNREAKDHSRLLHSIIVAAFHCLSLWLVQHPYLLNDPDCLQCVLETAELGISGTKSRSATGTSDRVLKAGKIPNPTSKRVKDAAEALLYCVMEQVDAFPCPTGPESCCSLLKEDTLMKYCCRTARDDAVHFRYFWVEPGLILGLLEQPLGNSQDCLPTVTAVIRGPFGRHAWTMQLRHLPRNLGQQGAEINLSVTSSQGSGGPAGSGDAGSNYVARPKPGATPSPTMKEEVEEDADVEERRPTYFPESVENIAKTKADDSIPPLEQVAQKERVRGEVDLMKSLIAHQTQFTNTVSDRVRKERAGAPYPNPETECKQPKRVPWAVKSPCHEFQTARLILTHLGYLSVNAWLHDSLADMTNVAGGKPGVDTGASNSGASDGLAGSPSSLGAGTIGGSVAAPSLPVLYPLDSSTGQFFDQLDALDALSTRTADTTYIFYVRQGQCKPSEIVANADDYSSLSVDFLDFLASLGWPVTVGEHAGWTGDPDTSYQLNEGRGGLYNSSTGGLPAGGLDGQKNVLYWADTTTEVAFLVPCSATSADAQEATGEGHNPHRSLSDAANTLPRTQLGPKSSFHSATGTRLVESTIEPSLGDDSGKWRGRRLWEDPYCTAIVWTEAYEDWETFPVADVVGAGALVIFIQPLRTGLYRIHLLRPHGRVHEAGPLITGMVLSRRCLGSLVRQTVINTNRRRRLDSDHFQPPQVRRSHKIHEIMSRHRMQDHSLPDLFTSLLHQPISTTEPRF